MEKFKRVQRAAIGVLGVSLMLMGCLWLVEQALTWGAIGCLFYCR